MGRRAVPAALAFGALFADLSGHHALALAGLLFAIPTAFALLLDCYGEALAARCGPFRPLTAAAGLLLIVFSAALRSPAVVGGVPRVAVSALAVASLFSLAAVAPLPAPAARRRVVPRRADSADASREDERLAA